jgi:hypothetical protein
MNCKREPGRSFGVLVLHSEGISGHYERNLRVGVEPIKKKPQVIRVNEEAEFRHAFMNPKKKVERLTSDYRSHKSNIAWRKMIRI